MKTVDCSTMSKDASPRLRATSVAEQFDFPGNSSLAAFNLLGRSCFREILRPKTELQQLQ